MLQNGHPKGLCNKRRRLAPLIDWRDTFYPLVVAHRQTIDQRAADYLAKMLSLLTTLELSGEVGLWNLVSQRRQSKD